MNFLHIYFTQNFMMLFKIYLPLFIYLLWKILNTKNRQPFLTGWSMLCIWFWSCNPPAHFISQHNSTAPFRPVSSLPRYTRALSSSYPILKACSSLKTRSRLKLCYKDFNTPKAFLSFALTFSQPYKIKLSITVLSLKINSLRYL